MRIFNLQIIMASYSKVVTGLTGMKVAKNPTHTLGVLYRYNISHFQSQFVLRLNFY